MASLGDGKVTGRKEREEVRVKTAGKENFGSTRQSATSKGHDALRQKCLNCNHTEK